MNESKGLQAQEEVAKESVDKQNDILKRCKYTFKLPPTTYNSEESLFDYLYRFPKESQEDLQNNIITKEEYEKRLTTPFTAIVTTTKASKGKVENDDFKYSVDIDILTTYYEVYPQLLNNKTYFINAQNKNTAPTSFKGTKTYISFSEAKYSGALGASLKESDLTFLMEILKIYDKKFHTNVYEKLTKNLKTKLSSSNLKNYWKNYFRNISCFFSNNRIKDITPQDYKNYQPYLPKNYNNDILLSCYDLAIPKATNKSINQYSHSFKSLPKSDLETEIKNNRIVALPELDLKIIIDLINDPEFKKAIENSIYKEPIQDTIENLNKYWAKIPVEQKAKINKYHTMKTTTINNSKKLEEFYELGSEVSSIYNKYCSNARRKFYFLTDQMGRTPYVALDFTNWKSLLDTQSKNIKLIEQIVKEKNRKIHQSINLTNDANLKIAAIAQKNQDKKTQKDNIVKSI